MQITNKYNLPEALVRAVRFDDYKRLGDYSVSEIVNPPQITILKRRYEDQIEDDAMNRLWMLLGKAVHVILERGASPDDLTEERLTYKTPNGVVSGIPDLYLEGGTLIDYKVTSAWSIIFGGRREWEEQLNCYAVLYRQAGFEVNTLKIVAILRDWTPRQAEMSTDYPDIPVKSLILEPWAKAKAEVFIEDRMRVLRENEGLPDDMLDACTPEEQWRRGKCWAVMEPGAKRARRLFETKEEAEEYLKGREYLVGFEIINRPGKAIRCSDYCPVREFCYQKKREEEKK